MYVEELIITLESGKVFFAKKQMAHLGMLGNETSPV
jgi:hypothetical protein